MSLYPLLLLAAGLCLAYADKAKIQVPPGVYPREETYVCTFVPLDNQEEHYITGFAPEVSNHNAHHILMFGCENPGSFDPVWDCGEMSAPADGMTRAPTCESNPSILYAWAKEAPELKLPKGVGFKVGGESKIQYLVMQVHYMHDKDEQDATAVVITHTDEPQPKKAATMLLVTGGQLTPLSKESFETACVIEEDVEIHPFAFRTHTHRHGIDVSGWVVEEDKTGNDRWSLIGRRDPQLPQMFEEVKNKSMVIRQGDMVSARCIMHNNEDRYISMGPTGEDEMCNYYLMYWTEGELLKDNTCFSPGAPLYYWGTEAKLNHIPK